MSTEQHKTAHNIETYHETSVYLELYYLTAHATVYYRACQKPFNAPCSGPSLFLYPRALVNDPHYNV